jgi:hypothetical protein
MLNTKKTILFAGIASILAVVLATTAVLANGTGVPGTVHTDLDLSGSTTLGPVMVNEETPASAASLGVTIAGVNQVSSGAGINDLNTFTNNGGGSFTWNPSGATNPCDIAMASRALKTSGTTGGTSYTESQIDVQTPVADDAVIMIVNNANTPSVVTSLTKQQIRGIYEDVYALSSNSGDSAGGTNEYWDAAAVTINSTGLKGDDGVNYDQNEYFPALPGYGVTGAHVQIVVYARNMESGTRGFLGDTNTHGGAAFAVSTSEPTSVTGTYPNANYYPLEQAFINSEDPSETYDASPYREASATNMQAAVNGATTAAIGYVGIGYDYNATTAPNLRDLTVEDDQNLASGSWSVAPYNPVPVDSNAYSATVNSNINVYSYHYHLSRYLYLDVYAPNSADTGITPMTDPNHANEEKLITWMTTLDSTGQDTVVTSNELRLVPDQDINDVGQVNYIDLTQLGIDYGQTDPSKYGPTHLRADINRGGVVNYLDLTDLGLWYGEVTQTLP